MGTNGVLDRVKTLPAKGELIDQHVITTVKPLYDYRVELDLLNVNTGAFYKRSA